MWKIRTIDSISMLVTTKLKSCLIFETNSKTKSTFIYLKNWTQILIFDYIQVWTKTKIFENIYWEKKTRIGGWVRGYKKLTTNSNPNYLKWNMVWFLEPESKFIVLKNWT